MTALPNPVAAWSIPVRFVLLAVAIAGCVVAYVRMSADARVMKAPPHGTSIIGFERLRSWERAEPVLTSWGAEGRRAARSSLWWDTLLFVPSYLLLGVLVAGVAADRAAGRGCPGWANAATVALYAVGVAAACDLVENYALFRVLRPGRDVSWPGIATGFATAKFVLIGVALLVTAAAFVGPHSARSP